MFILFLSVADRSFQSLLAHHFPITLHQLLRQHPHIPRLNHPLPRPARQPPGFIAIFKQLHNLPREFQRILRPASKSRRLSPPAPRPPTASKPPGFPPRTPPAISPASPTRSGSDTRTQHSAPAARAHLPRIRAARCCREDAGSECLGGGSAPTMIKPRSWFALQHRRQYLLREPAQPFLIRKMAKAPQEQHRFRLASLRLKLIPRRRDPRPIIVNPSAQPRHEPQQIVAVVGTAHLHAIEPRQHPQFIPQGSQIFIRRLGPVEESRARCQAPARSIENRCRARTPRTPAADSRLHIG